MTLIKPFALFSSAFFINLKFENFDKKLYTHWIETSRQPLVRSTNAHFSSMWALYCRVSVENVFSSQSILSIDMSRVLWLPWYPYKKHYQTYVLIRGCERIKSAWSSSDGGLQEMVPWSHMTDDIHCYFVRLSRALRKTLLKMVSKQMKSELIWNFIFCILFI